MPSRCFFCQHGNPTGAKYCNECGCAMDWRPCERCGAMNDIDATHCRDCGGQFTSAATGDDTTSAVRDESAQSDSSVARALEIIGAERTRDSQGRTQPGGLVIANIERASSRSTVVIGAVFVAVAIGALLYGSARTVGLNASTHTPAAQGDTREASGLVDQSQVVEHKATDQIPVVADAASRRETVATSANTSNGTTTSMSASPRVPLPDANDLTAGQPDAPAPVVSTSPAAAKPDATAGTVPDSSPRKNAARRTQMASGSQHDTPGSLRERNGGNLSLRTEPPDYLKQAGECTDGVAALGLCAPKRLSRR